MVRKKNISNQPWREQRLLFALITSLLVINLFSSSANGAQVTFDVEITAQGDEIRSYSPVTISGNFPYFDISGNESRTETHELCMTQQQKQECSLDTSVGDGSGFSVRVTTLNSPGGSPYQSYYFDTTKKCLMSAVTIHSKRQQRGWYASDQSLYIKCPVWARWSSTPPQKLTSVVLDSAEGYKFIAGYSGPIGTPLQLNNSARIDVNNGYSVKITNKNPSDAVITSGMFSGTPQQGSNGANFYALYAPNDITAKAIEVTQGIQNLYNDMPLVAGRRTYVRVYANASFPATNIGAELHAYKNGNELPGSPILAESDISIRNTGIDRTNLNHAFLFKLPSAWYAAGVRELKAVIDPSGLYKDINPTNNVLSVSANFQESQFTAYHVIDVPLEIHENGDGSKPVRIYEATSNSYDEITKNLIRMYPIAEQYHDDLGIKPLKPTLEIQSWDVSLMHHWFHMLHRVELRRELAAAKYTGDSFFWQGMVHPDFENVSPFKGVSTVRAQSSVEIMSGQRTPGADWSMPSGETFAHEIGHNLGFKHECAGYDPEDNISELTGDYPYNYDCYMGRGNPAFFSNGHDGYFITDVFHDLWGLNDPSILGSDYATNAGATDFPSAQEVTPLMSPNASKRWLTAYDYCKALTQTCKISCKEQLITQHLPDSSRRMVAKQQAKEFMREILADAIIPPASFVPAFSVSAAVLPNGFIPQRVQTSSSNYLVINGIYDLTKTTLDAFTLTKQSTLTSSALLANANALQDALLNLHQTTYTNVLVLNQYDNQSSHRLIRADIVSDLNTQVNQYSPDRNFIGLVNTSNDATYFELTYGTHVVAFVKGSNNPPVVSILPFSETTLTANSIINWKSSDLDKDPLTFSIYYRRNPIDPWQLIDMDITSNSYAMTDNLPNSQTNPLRYYAGSTTGQFKVVAYDGFNTSEAVSNTINVPLNAPAVSISQKSGLSIKLGQTLLLNGSANDREDGTLPSDATVKAIIQGQNVPMTNFQWSSNINGVIGYGYKIATRNLSKGIHKITLSVSDSDRMIGTSTIYVSVGMESSPSSNIALLASATASSTYCASASASEHCYSPSRINDGSNATSVSGLQSWTNNNGQPLPQWVQLSWPSKVLISEAEIFTSLGYEVQDYDLQYWNGSEWITTNSVRGNIAVNNKHALANPIVTDKLRLLGIRGPQQQFSFIRVNEIIVKGSVLN